MTNGCITRIRNYVESGNEHATDILMIPFKLACYICVSFSILACKQRITHVVRAAGKRDAFVKYEISDNVHEVSQYLLATTEFFCK